MAVNIKEVSLTVARRCSVNLNVLTNFAKPTENTFAGVSFYCRCCRAETSLKRDSGTVFSCEFCEIFQNTFLIEDLRATASLFADQIYLKDLIYST